MVSRRHRVAQTLADPRRAIAVAALVLTLVVCIDVLSDPDIWWHLRLGQWIIDNHTIPKGELFSYTALGNPLTAHEWLTDVIFATLQSIGGLLLVAVVMSLVMWSAFGAVALRLRGRGVGPLTFAIGLALAAKAAEPVLGTRPQVVTVALVAWTLLLADVALRRGGNWPWLLPPIFLLWANLHAGFLSGLGILGLIAFGELLVVWRRPQHGAPRRNVVMLIAALAASAIVACINPAGPRLYWFALTVPGSERAKAIVEWQPPNFADSSLWPLLAFIVTLGALVIACLAVKKWRSAIRLRELLPTIATAGLALYGVRNTAICVVTTAPMWIAMASRMIATSEFLHKRPQRTVVVSRVSVSFGAVICAIAVAAVGWTYGRAAHDASPSGIAQGYPSCAVSRLAAAPAPQHVFATYGDAGFVINKLWPQSSVYEYGESISLGLTVFNDYIRIASDAQDSPSALQLLTQSNTTAVLVVKSPLVDDLVAHGWNIVVTDTPTSIVLLVKGSPAWAQNVAPC